MIRMDSRQCYCVARATWVRDTGNRLKVSGHDISEWGEVGQSLAYLQRSRQEKADERHVWILVIGHSRLVKANSLSCMCMIGTHSKYWAGCSVPWSYGGHETERLGT